MTANCARRPYINHSEYIFEGMLISFFILVLTVNLSVINLSVCCLLFAILVLIFVMVTYTQGLSK